MWGAERDVCMRNPDENPGRVWGTASSTCSTPVSVPPVACSEKRCRSLLLGAVRVRAPHPASPSSRAKVLLLTRCDCGTPGKVAHGTGWTYDVCLVLLLSNKGCEIVSVSCGRRE